MFATVYLIHNMREQSEWRPDKVPAGVRHDDPSGYRWDFFKLCFIASRQRPGTLMNAAASSIELSPDYAMPRSDFRSLAAHIPSTVHQQCQVGGPEIRSARLGIGGLYLPE